MPAYLIADTRRIDGADQGPYEEYRRRVGASIAEAGGRFLVRSDQLDVVEGQWRPAWLVVIEFPSLQALRAWYESDAYRELKELRLLSTEGDAGRIASASIGSAQAAWQKRTRSPVRLATPTRFGVGLTRLGRAS